MGTPGRSISETVQECRNIAIGWGLGVIGGAEEGRTPGLRIAN